MSLCKFSTLPSLPSNTTPSAVEDSLSLFARSRKAQLATLAAFQLAAEHGHYFREGWRNVLNCIITLHRLDILPCLVDITEFLDACGNVHAEQTPKQPARGGLLSFALLGTGSWFGGDTADEPSEIVVQLRDICRQCVDQCNIKDIILSSKRLQADSLVYLVKALILGSMASPNARQQEESDAILCLEMLTNVTLVNQERIILLWVLVNEHIIGIIQNASKATPLMKRTIACLLLLCCRLAHRKEISDQLFRSVESLAKINTRVRPHVCEIICNGFTKLLDSNHKAIRTTAAWNAITSVLIGLNIGKMCTTLTFRTMGRFIQHSKSSISSVNLTPLLTILQEYAKIRVAGSTVSISAIEWIASMFGLVGQSIRLPGMEEGAELTVDMEADALERFWLPILVCLMEVCVDPRQDVRNNAMSCLQACLMSPRLLQCSPASWQTIFDQVLFPLLDRLLTRFPAQEDVSAVGVEEARLRASQLVSKIFLQILSKLTTLPAFEKLWLRILHFIELYMKAESSDLLAEAIPEALKNLLLVMLSSGSFRPQMMTSTGQDIWELSWDTIDTFCPHLKEDVLAKAVVYERDRSQQPGSSSTPSETEPLPGLLPSEPLPGLLPSEPLPGLLSSEPLPGTSVEPAADPSVFAAHAPSEGAPPAPVHAPGAGDHRRAAQSLPSVAVAAGGGDAAAALQTPSASAANLSGGGGGGGGGTPFENDFVLVSQQ